MNKMDGTWKTINRGSKGHFFKLNSGTALCGAPRHKCGKFTDSDYWRCSKCNKIYKKSENSDE